MMKIGLLGLTTDSPNKGCEALTYGFLEILNCIAKNTNVMYNVVIIMQFSKRQFLHSLRQRRNYYTYYLPVALYSNLSIEYAVFYNYKNNIALSRQVNSCDVIFDFTGGDSFSDIYGKGRFNLGTAVKKKVIEQKIPLVLGSQTIGPFMAQDVKEKAAYILQKCHTVLARDRISEEYVRKHFGVNSILTTDVAFALPYQNQADLRNGKRIGFNPSGLLWDGGYTNNNQFALKVDYRTYCLQTIDFLIRSGYEVHLIPHCFVENVNAVENDYKACVELYKTFPQAVVAPLFEHATDAKSYISGLDLLIAARMHATIGAISSGTPVIPFSYSRKFEGLFWDLDYPYIVDAKGWDTDYAVKTTCEWVLDMPSLRKSTGRVYSQISFQKKELIKCYSAILSEIGE